MKIMNKVTLEYLKKNKRRTIVTILGVIISVAMITAVSTFMGTFMDWTRRDFIERDGDWQAQFVGVPMENTEAILTHDNTAEGVLSRDIGWAKADVRTVAANATPLEYLKIREYEDKSFAFRSIKPTQGRIPQNENELLLYELANGRLKHPLSLGDSVTLPVGERTDTEGKPVTWVSTSYGEVFTEKLLKTYTVVGFIADSVYIGSTNSMTAYSGLPALSPADVVDVTIRAKQAPADFYERVSTYSQTFPNQGVIFNDDLLKTMGVLADTQVLGTLSGVIIIVGLIIMLGSVMLIYNAFAISISERSRQLGMLSSVGATRVQKRNSVFFEGAVIGAIAIPLGIVFGILGIGITFALVDPMIRETLNFTVSLRLKVEPSAIAIAVFFSALTIFISLWIPARRASRITPIDAIRQTQDIKLTGRQVKTSRLSRRLFGFEGELALKTLKRNRKRYRATVLSLTVSILLVLTVSGFSHFVGKTNELVFAEMPYDITLEISSKDAAKRLALLGQVAGMEGVSGAVRQQIYPAETKLPAAALTDNALAEFGGGKAAVSIPALAIVSLNDEALRDYAKSIGLDFSLLLDTTRPHGILRDVLQVRHGSRFKEFKLFKPDAPQSLPLLLGDAAAMDMAFSIAPAPSPYFLSSYGIASLLVSESVFNAIPKPTKADQLNTVSQMLFLRSENPDALEQQIEELMKLDGALPPDASYSLTNVAAQARTQLQIGNVISVFVYGFVALIALIAIANTFNTISTSVALRKREFAMLKSVGMTPGGFRRMIRLESVFYGAKSLLYGLPLGFGVMLLIHHSLQGHFSFPFTLPWKAIFIVIAAIFLIVGLTMFYSSGKVRQTNIVDALTEENL